MTDAWLHRNTSELCVIYRQYRRAIILRKLVDDILRHLVKGIRQTHRTLERPRYLFNLHKIRCNHGQRMGRYYQAYEHIHVEWAYWIFSTQVPGTSSHIKKDIKWITSNIRRPNKISTAHVAESNNNCTYCKGKHYVFQCQDFLKLSSEDRGKSKKQTIVFKLLAINNPLRQRLQSVNLSDM